MKQKNENETMSKNKQKASKEKIVIRIVAAILVALMVLSVCATGIYYLFYMFSAK